MFKFRKSKSPKVCLPLAERCRRCSVCGDRGECVVQLQYAWKPLAHQISDIMVSTTNQSLWTDPQQGSVGMKKLTTSGISANHFADDRINEQEEVIDQSEVISLQKGSVRRKKLPSTRRRPTHTPDNSIMEELGATSQLAEPSPQPRSFRKKKLSSSRRRARQWANDSITDENEKKDGSNVKEKDSSEYSHDNRENDNTIAIESVQQDYELENQDDKECGIYINDIENRHENYSILTSQVMDSSNDSDKEKNHMQKKVYMNNDLINNMFAAKYNANKPNKPKSGQTLLKLMEKFSHLHSLQGIMQKKNKNNEVGNFVNNSNKKNKRPSVKVNKRHTKRSSTKSNSSVRSNSKISNQAEIIQTVEPLLSSNTSITYLNSTPPDSQSDTDNEDTLSNMENLRNAQIKMMMQILSQLYEKNLTRQDTELNHLRTHVQTHEKLMMQLVHLNMDLKADIDKLKYSHSLENESRTVNERLKTNEQPDNDMNLGNEFKTENENLNKTETLDNDLSSNRNSIEKDDIH
ncbi:unnamed protein product, partial [Meganyctiphanes norvegica]